MKSKGVVLVLCAVALGWASGYWSGRARGQKLAQAKLTSAGNSNSAPAQTLPPIKRKQKAKEEEPESPSKLTLDQLEVKLLTSRDGYGSHEWQRVLDSLSAADISRLLAVLEKKPVQARRSGLRIGLLGRLAELDSAAAMDVANALPIRSERESAILAVVRTWSEKEP